MKAMSNVFGAMAVLTITGQTLAAQAPPPTRPGPEHEKLGYFGT
jgi:hypothetical protein